jgi:hypothetical protein
MLKKNNKKENEAKELLLMEIEGSSSWRAAMASKYPDQEEINLMASESLMRLYNYIDNLPDDNPLFEWYWHWMKDESSNEILNSEIRSYGYQNITENPQEFLARLMSDSSESIEDETIE